MAQINGKVRLSLFGQFRVEAPSGEDLTPKGAKAQGLLALLAFDQRHRRSRTWLQDKLWSDRGQAQGAASLRQALAEIRKAFGAHVGALYTDRRVVALEAAKVAIVAPPVAVAQAEEFLEGIDIRDPEFEDWLRAVRSRAAAGELAIGTEPAEAAPLRRDRSSYRKIVLLSMTEDANLQRLLEDQFVDVAARSIRETFSVDVHVQLPSKADPGMLLVSVQAFELRGTHIGIRTILEDADTQRSLWSDSVAAKHLPGPISQSIDHMGLCHRLMDALSDALISETLPQRSDADANLLAGMALRKMFSMGHNALGEADRLLGQATELAPRGVFDAWRAQLAAIQYVERQGKSRAELLDRAASFSARAIAAEPMNSNVLSCLANARLILEDNLVASGELASMSVEVNPANPLAWWALANATLYNGDHARAYDAAKIAQRLSQNSLLKFWSDFQVSLIAAVTDRPEEAIANSELSSALAPNFRPPLRYLTALYAKVGKHSDATRTAKRLRRLEPDFTIGRMISDTNYPISMMRKSALVDPQRLSVIEL